MRHGERWVGAVAAVLFLAAMVCPSAGADDSADAVALMRSVAANYQDLGSSEVIGRVRGTKPGEPGSLEIELRSARAGTAFVPPTSPVPMFPEAVGWGRVAFFDADGTAQTSPPAWLPHPLEPPHSCTLFDGLALGIESASRKGSETLNVDGEEIPCEVVEVVHAAAPHSRQRGTIRYWVDPRRLVILQQTFTEPNGEGGTALDWTYKVSSLKINQPPPQWLLDLGPKMVGRQIDTWVGSDAPAFSLNDLDGQQVDSSELKGKVVLLEFWGTWCGPCHEEMQVVEKLRDTYGAKGVELLGVTDEEATVASDWLVRHHRTLRTLTDPSRSLFDSYKVTAIPVVVVVGRDGRVVAFFEGLHRAAALGEALEKALR
jgi:peroxiredoxin